MKSGWNQADGNHHSHVRHSISTHPCCVTCFLARPEQHLLTPDRELVTDQSEDTTASNSRKGERLLTGEGVAKGSWIISPAQHEWQLIKTGTLDFSAELGGSLACRNHLFLAVLVACITLGGRNLEHLVNIRASLKSPLLRKPVISRTSWILEFPCKMECVHCYTAPPNHLPIPTVSSPTLDTEPFTVDGRCQMPRCACLEWNWSCEH